MTTSFRRSLVLVVVVLLALLGVLAPPMLRPVPTNAAVPTPTPTSTRPTDVDDADRVASDASMRLVPNNERPDSALEASLVTSERAASNRAAALADELAALSYAEQERLARAALLPSELAGELLRDTQSRDTVLIQRIFLPMLGRQDAPPTPTPTLAPTPQPTATPRPTQRPNDDDDDDNGGGDLSLTIRANPSIRVARDSILAYDLTLTNFSGDDVGRTVIRLPYSNRQLRITDSSLGRRDFVSRITRTYVEVTFGELDGNRARTGTVFFRVNRSLRDNTVIAMRGSITWNNGARGMSSNWAPVIVGGSNDTTPYVWLAVAPDQGPPGTTHRFSTDRFIPGEPVAYWLNTPRGVEGDIKGFDADDTADDRGRVFADLHTRGYEPGFYSLVARGKRSGLEAVRAFIVR